MFGDTLSKYNLTLVLEHAVQSPFLLYRLFDKAPIRAIEWLETDLYPDGLESSIV